MIEVCGDIWNYQPFADSSKYKVLRCIPTNGYTRISNNELVMGAGLAKDAKDRYCYLPKIFGEHVLKNGNNVCIVDEYSIASFPTKECFWQKASLTLIERSAILLRHLTLEKWDCVLLPRVGCGLGGLKWETVSKTISKILSESMFIVVNKE